MKPFQCRTYQHGKSRKQWVHKYTIALYAYHEGQRVPCVPSKCCACKEFQWRQARQLEDTTRDGEDCCRRLCAAHCTFLRPKVTCWDFGLSCVGWKDRQGDTVSLLLGTKDVSSCCGCCCCLHRLCLWWWVRRWLSNVRGSLEITNLT